MAEIAPEVLLLAKNFQKAPAPTLYKCWLQVYSDMITHTQGRIGYKIKLKRPGEPPNIYAYRLANGRPVTKHSIQKAISNVSRIFQSQSWSFKGSPALVDFVTNGMFDGLSFRQWQERNIIANMIEDPNGIILWLPDVTGEAFTPKIFNSRKIRYISDSALIVCEKDIKESAVELMRIKPDANLATHDFLKQETRFLAVTKQGIYRFVTVGENIEVTPIIVADFDFLPYVMFGGVTASAGYYESFFQSICPFGDEAIAEYSDHQAVNVIFSYPVREELGMKCTAKGCRNGIIVKGGVDTPCEECNGTGKVPAHSPYGIYFKKDRTARDEGLPDQKSVEFTSPDANILNYSSTEWEKKLHKAEDAIQLVRIWDNQSGTAKLIDREGLYSILTDIKNNVFDNVIYKSLLILEYYLSHTPVDPIVYKPVDLVIKSSGDMTDEVKAVSDPNVPKFVVSQVVLEQLLKKYTDNDYRKRIIEFMSRVDPMFGYSQSEKERTGATGLLPKAVVTRSIVMPALLEKLANEQSNFAEMKDDAILAWIEKNMKEFLPQQAVMRDALGNVITTA